MTSVLAAIAMVIFGLVALVFIVYMLSRLVMFAWLQVIKEFLNKEHLTETLHLKGKDKHE